FQGDIDHAISSESSPEVAPLHAQGLGRRPHRRQGLQPHLGALEHLLVHENTQQDRAPDWAAWGRREFLASASLLPIFAASSGGHRAVASNDVGPRRARFFFTSKGKTGLVNADGSGLRYFEFDKPGQATWQPGPMFADGRRVIFLSMEPRRDGPGRPFEEY